ncbi:MAG: valine--tRNA ligase [Thermoplasmata archaeon]|nr:valine--tRNA ligase [Thermoplasmata archaeon]
MNGYNALDVEKKWQQKWKEMGIYKFEKGKEPVYSIDNPPRYASGALHIGHAVHYTHIDFIARYKRMRGYNVFFPLCFDVNGIPIEERVERKLGITRKDIDRHEFIKLCKEFADENIEEMIRQFEMLGESMDDTIYYRTDAEYYRRLTQISFIELYKKGLIYKGKFPVNWCPRCMTAMADAEIEHINRKTMLNTLKFYFVDYTPTNKMKGIGKDERGWYVEIATTRPELLATCQMAAINPNDDRAPYLAGRKIRVPIFGQNIEIVEDDKVDPEFGTGVVMICTIGDKDDLDWAMKYGLELKICINEDGTLNSLAGKYEGMKIEEAKKAIIEDLKKDGYLIKQDELEQSVGVCWRCKTPVEFIQTEQWFLKILPFKEEVLKAANRMKWYPEHMKKRLEEWVSSLKWDWVISRQRYFATPLPLWECENGHVVLAEEQQCYVDPTIDAPPVERCPICGAKLKGSEHVFDTWMDSSISPLYNTFWKRDEQLFQKLYPMSLRPQAHDIIRTWAFYTILRGILLTGKEPFREVMIDGFILAPDGKPMHTSLGNVIDPIEIMKEHGADALRYYAANCKLGEDNPFRFKDLVRGKRLMNKIWNIEKFIGNAIHEKPEKPDELNIVDKWILSLYSRMVEEVTKHMDSFEFSDAMKKIEYFIWHEFADHYIEMVKYRIYSNKDSSALYTLYEIGFGIAKLIAPFLPFIAEEIYHEYFKKFEGNESIHIASWPQPMFIDEEAIKKGEEIKKVIAKIREWKNKNGIALNAPIEKVKISGMGEEGKETIKRTMKIKELEIGGFEVQYESMAEPLYDKIGPAFKEKSRLIINEIKKNPQKIAAEIEEKGYAIIDDEGNAIKLDKQFVRISKKPKGKSLIEIDDIAILIE